MTVDASFTDDEAELVASALRRQSNRSDYSDEERDTLQEISDTLRRATGP